MQVHSQYHHYCMQVNYVRQEYYPYARVLRNYNLKEHCVRTLRKSTV